MCAHCVCKGRINTLWNTPEYRAKYPDLPPEPSYFNCHLMRPGDITINSTRAYDLDPTNADDLTKAEIMTRKQAWAIWRFLRDNVPGFERSQIVATGTHVGIRESRLIEGDYRVTLQDGMNNKRFEDSVMTVGVWFDLHEKKEYINRTTAESRNLVGGGRV